MNIRNMFRRRPPSNLVAHARRELALIGEEPATVDGYVKVIQAFADMGHSGGSASVAIPTIHRLLNFENLARLTDNPDDWIEVGYGLWQNRRCSRMFSEDGGKTYTDVNDDGPASERPVHTSAICGPTTPDPTPTRITGQQIIMLILGSVLAIVAGGCFAAAVMVLQFGDQPDATTGMFGFVTIAAFAGFGAFGCGYRFRHGEWP